MLNFLSVYFFTLFQTMFILYVYVMDLLQFFCWINALITFECQILDFIIFFALLILYAFNHI